MQEMLGTKGGRRSKGIVDGMISQRNFVRGLGSIGWMKHASPICFDFNKMEVTFEKEGKKITNREQGIWDMQDDYKEKTAEDHKAQDELGGSIVFHPSHKSNGGAGIKRGIHAHCEHPTPT